MALGLLAFVTPKVNATDCSAGNSWVKSSWWPPSNDTFYLLCNCGYTKGYDAGGSCSVGGGEQ